VDIKKFAEKFIEAEHQAFQQGNFGALEQIESRNIVIHMPPVPDFNGFEAHKQYIVNGCKSSTNLQQEWGYITGDGNVAVLSLKQRATLTEDNQAFKIPAGSTINTDGFFVLRRENDKIVEIWIKSSMEVIPPNR
jgi:hypothetical protein